MRPASAVLIATLALALASCGGGSTSTSTGSTAAKAPGPTGSSGATGSGHEKGYDAAQARHARLPALSGGSGFNGSSVEVSFVNTSYPFGVKSAVTYFIAKGSAGSALAQAKACVQAYLTKAPSAYCFAFASQRAFRLSGVSRRPPADMRKPCWIAYWGKPKGRRAIGSASNPASGPLHCPGA